MIKNYLTIVWRTLQRQKIYSAINIFGLTTGVTASLLILLYVADELSYDRFHPDAERIYRVDFHGKIQDEPLITATTGLPTADAVQREAAGIESVVRLDKWPTCPIRYEENTFTEMHFMLADSNFFSFFNFPLIHGNPSDVLLGPNKIVISERAAKRYFGYKGAGDLSPIGKTMVVGSEGNITAEVTGIAADPPENSHIVFDFVMSLETSGYVNNPIWLNSEVYTYFKTYPGTDVANVQKTLTGFVEKYCARELQQFLNVSLDQFNKQGGHIKFVAVPMTDIHLHSQLTDELEPNGNIQYVYLFSIIAGFIVVLACINFMNLSTARSAPRQRNWCSQNHWRSPQAAYVSVYHGVVRVCCGGIHCFLRSGVCADQSVQYTFWQSAYGIYAFSAGVHCRVCAFYDYHRLAGRKLSGILFNRVQTG